MPLPLGLGELPHKLTVEELRLGYYLCIYQGSPLSKLLRRYWDRLGFRILLFIIKAGKRIVKFKMC